MTGTTGNTQTTTSPHATREGWLLLASDLLAQELFAPHGYRVPSVKVSVGYASTGLRSSAIGQCWSRKSAEDDTNHIFISPSLGTAYEVIDTLTHELVHAVDDCEHRHGKAFRKIALAIGLQGPMRSASAAWTSDWPSSGHTARVRIVMRSSAETRCCEGCRYVGVMLARACS